VTSNCGLCGEPMSLDGDTIDCELSKEREHYVCHNDVGHEHDLWLAPMLAKLSRHSAECVDAAMGGSPWDDEESARGWAAQSLEDGHYEWICSEGSRREM
jgi:hypothetical protein